jgi:hypothetical protein
MKHHRCNRLFRFAAALALLANFYPFTATAETALETQQDLERWYQVDVILFKPRRADLDDESWPEHEKSYPADVVAVTDPRPFKLSQLKQLGEQPVIEATEVPALRTDEFAFQSSSRNRQNRRVIESLTGVTRDDSAIDATEGANPENPGAQENLEMPLSPTSEPAIDIDTLIAGALQNSYGRIAFSTAEASSLETIERSLNRSSRFDVLSHQSWIQPIDENPMPIIVQAGKRYDDRYELEGTLTLSRSRYLHVATDLWYTTFEPRGVNRQPGMEGYTEDPTAGIPGELLTEYPELVQVERQRGQFYPARTHIMAQSRRMRSDELHYVDHPLFGMVIRVNRYAFVDEAEE